MKTPSGIVLGSTVRAPRPPLLPRKIWVLGLNPERLQIAVEVIQAAGHEAKAGEPGGELGPALKDFRPDAIIIDLGDAPERGRHFATQLRADRATRQLPIVLVGVSGEEGQKADKAVTGPTRRYVNALDAPTVLNSILSDL
jgi:CheY-like chemotaxis protein